MTDLCHQGRLSSRTPNPSPDDTLRAPDDSGVCDEAASMRESQSNAVDSHLPALCPTCQAPILYSLSRHGVRIRHYQCGGEVWGDGSQYCPEIHSGSEEGPSSEDAIPLAEQVAIFDAHARDELSALKDLIFERRDIILALARDRLVTIGYPQYRDKSFKLSADERAYELDCELADALVYAISKHAPPS